MFFAGHYIDTSMSYDEGVGVFMIFQKSVDFCGEFLNIMKGLSVATVMGSVVDTAALLSHFILC